MSLTTTKYIAVASLSVLLTACGDSGLDKKSGKVLYQEAAQHLYTKDSQFNFNADFLVDIENENPMLQGLKIKLSGAANNSAQRYELIPEVQAAIFNFKLPMLIDGKKHEALFDTSSVVETALMFAPQAQSELQQYKNKFVRFSPDNFTIDEDDMAQALVVMTEALTIGGGVLNEFYQAVPESSIQKLALDDTAKQLDAKALLSVNLNKRQSKALQEHINTYMYDAVAANKKLPKDFKRGFLEALEENEVDGGYESSESMLYLNAKGQIIHEVSVFNYEIEGEEVSFNATVDYSNYGKANFTLSPKKNQIIDITEENLSAIQDM